MAYSRSVIALLNREMIVVEILQSLVGSSGILLTIPLTSLVCAVIYSHAKGTAGAKAPEPLPAQPAAHKDMPL